MGTFGSQLLTAAKDGLTGGLASGISGAVSGLTGLIGQIGAKKRMKELAKYQTDLQKELNEQAAELNYEYGEKAAENAYARQMEMYNRSYADQSYSAMRKQMEDAGLSVGLMYGKGGASGGGAGSTSGAPQGATGGAQAGQAATAAEMYMAQIQEKRLNLENAKLAAEIQNIKADSRNKDANAENANARTMTENALRHITSVAKFVEAKSIWIDNLRKEWEDGEWRNREWSDPDFGFYEILTDSRQNEMFTATLNKTMAESGYFDAKKTEALSNAMLSNTRIRTEMMRAKAALAQADAMGVIAAAKEIEAETRRLDFEHKYGLKMTPYQWAMAIVSAGGTVAQVISSFKGWGNQTITFDAQQMGETITERYNGKGQMTGTTVTRSSGTSGGRRGK